MTVSLDWDRLTTTATHQSDWAGLAWSPWRDLTSVPTTLVPPDPGIYRLRTPAVDGLLAIVEFDQRSSQLGGQLATLAKTIYADRENRVLSNSSSEPEPDRLADWLIRRCGTIGSTRLDVSYATPPRADRGQWIRRGIVAALVGIHRLATDRWPWPVDRADTPAGCDRPSTALPSWTQWDRPRSSAWLGFDWTAPRRLDAIETTTLSGPGFYRIWRPAEAEGTLRYVGGGDCRSIDRHRAIDGSDARWSSTTSLIDGHLDDTTWWAGLRTELIGAHHLAVGHPPVRQFGDDTVVGESP